MRHTTISQYEEAIRQFCRECQGDKKLCSGHCTSANCTFYDDRNALVEKSNQLTIFTKDGFYSAALGYLSNNYNDFLNEVWWSDIRLKIEQYLDSIRALKPGKKNKNWWGGLQSRISRIGWTCDKSFVRTSPITRSDEYLYRKRMARKVA